MSGRRLCSDCLDVKGRGSQGFDELNLTLTLSLHSLSVLLCAPNRPARGHFCLLVTGTLLPFLFPTSLKILQPCREPFSFQLSSPHIYKYKNRHIILSCVYVCVVLWFTICSCEHAQVCVCACTRVRTYVYKREVDVRYLPQSLSV